MFVKALQSVASICRLAIQQASCLCRLLQPAQYEVPLWMPPQVKFALKHELMVQPPWDEQLKLDSGEEACILHYTYGRVLTVCF